MPKVTVNPSLFVPPMPVSLVGTEVDGKPTFTAVAWFARVNHQPPLVAIAVNAGHYVTRGLREHGAFSLNLPGRDLVAETDYCGLVSGKRGDKSEVFETYRGELDHAPLIARCPLGVECRVERVVELPSNHLFIGEVMAVHTEERFLTDGKPDMAKIDPLLLTMPDNRYRVFGDAVGRAWHDGKTLKG
jgi:flavin reductase (DIM6/NTAB) family NADH-FMN oxidoreductase RutF